MSGQVIHTSIALKKIDGSSNLGAFVTSSDRLPIKHFTLQLLLRTLTSITVLNDSTEIRKCNTYQILAPAMSPTLTSVLLLPISASLLSAL